MVNGKLFFFAAFLFKAELGQCLNGPDSSLAHRPNDSCNFSAQTSISLYLPYVSAIR
jgi:hypothetical protein